MSEDNYKDEEEMELEPKSEFDILKERAEMLGLRFSKNIGIDTLRARVNDALNSDKSVQGDTIDEDDYEEDSKEEPVTTKTRPKLDKALASKFGETPNEKRNRLRKEATRLVRVNITCMNPTKKGLKGEIFTACNSVIGTVRKFVPFNGTEGYYIPRILLNMIQERKYNHIYTEKVQGVDVPRSSLVKEFAVEILPDLNNKQLSELARRQAMAKAAD